MRWIGIGGTSHERDASPPVEELIEVLRSARQLLALPDNNFDWSSWHSSDDALREIDGLLSQLTRGVVPARLDVSVLFAVTGPIQEVSLSSGWAEPFLAIAERFDHVEPRIWTT